eukprot:3786942-Pyramimonas_sp.AAC.1
MPTRNPVPTTHQMLVARPGGDTSRQKGKFTPSDGGSTLCALESNLPDGGSTLCALESNPPD